MVNIEITSIGNIKNVDNEVRGVEIMLEEVLKNTNKRNQLMNKKEIKSLKSQLKKMKTVSRK